MMRYYRLCVNSGHKHGNYRRHSGLHPPTSNTPRSNGNTDFDNMGTIARSGHIVYSIRSLPTPTQKQIVHGHSLSTIDDGPSDAVLT